MYKRQAQEPDAPGAAELEKADGRVSVENVSFSYRKEVPLLTDISIDVKPGQRIAIVGPTGCGKTTMINLLMRFYDVDKGQIKAVSYTHLDVYKRQLPYSRRFLLQHFR